MRAKLKWSFPLLLTFAPPDVSFLYANANQSVWLKDWLMTYRWQHAFRILLFPKLAAATAPLLRLDSAAHNTHAHEFALCVN